MSDAIQFSLAYEPKTIALIEHLRTAPERIMPAIARGLQRGAILAAGHIQTRRLSGPSSVSGGRLGIRTHTLINSLRPDESVTPVTVTSDTASVSIGTNVKGYPRAHEFGFNGQVHVPEHTRRNRSGKSSQVRSHTRWLSIPARHWLGGGMADEVATFNTEIRGALRGAVLGRDFA